MKRADFFIPLFLLQTVAGCVQGTSTNDSLNDYWQCGYYGCPQAGSGSSGGDSGGTASAAPDNTPPQFAGAAAISPIAGTDYRVSWLTAVDNQTSSASIVYKVFVSDSYPWPYASAQQTYSVAGGLSATIPLTGSNQRYYVSVRAIDQAGNSDQNTVVLQIVTADATPSVFAGIRGASATGANSAYLYWETGRDNVDFYDQLTHLVFVSQTPGVFDFNNPTVTVPPSLNSMYNLTGLMPDTLYYVAVRERDRAGNTETNTVYRSFRTGTDLSLPVTTSFTKAQFTETTDGTIYAVGIDTAANRKARVLRRASSGVWSDLGLVSACTTTCNYAKIAAGNAADSVYVLVQGNNRIYVWQYSASGGWIDLAFPADGIGDYTKLIYDTAANRPVVFYKSAAGLSQKSFVAGVWITGSNSIASVYWDYAILFAGIANQYHVSFYNVSLDRTRYGLWDLQTGFTDKGNLQQYAMGAGDPLTIILDPADNSPVFFVRESGANKMKKPDADGNLQSVLAAGDSYSPFRLATVNRTNNYRLLSLEGSSSAALSAWNGTAWDSSFSARSINDLAGARSGGVFVMGEHSTSNTGQMSLWKLR